ncbi:MAG: NUDIX hydrolase [Myxococcota bacterium]
MLLDLAWRTAYRTAYSGMRIYWRVRRPDTHGALVALWKEDAILLAKPSYLRYWNLPGGYVKPKETGREAALRELGEEVGIRGVDPDALTLVYDETREWEGKNDRVEIFALDVEDEPTIRVDNREIVEARFVPAAEALAMPLFPPIADVIRGRSAL